MACEIEYTDEFFEWFDALSAEEQDSVAAKVGLLEAVSVALGDPHSSSVLTSEHGNMRELRVQHAGRPYRVLYAFDPRRTGILLIGGDKTRDARWYERMVPIADRLYRVHLKTLGEGGV
jgi:hypothetical protein